MFKVCFALAVCIVVVAAQVPSVCPVFPDPICVSAGGNCSDSNAICTKGLYCLESETNFTCVSLLSAGSVCQYGEQCNGYDYNTADCVLGVCRTLTYTAQLNQVCNVTNNCGASLVCNGTVCVAMSTEGQSCLTNPCSLDLTCNFGTCVKYFSVPAGGLCDITATADDAAGRSTVCAANLFCLATNVANFSGVCTALNGTSSKMACNATTVCPNQYETCSCVNTNSVCLAPLVFTSDETSKYANYHACTNKCANPEASDCCTKEACVILDVAFPNMDTTTRDNLFKCDDPNPVNTCKSSGGWSTKKIAIIAGVVGGVVLIAVIIVFFARRHRHHDYNKI